MQPADLKIVANSEQCKKDVVFGFIRECRLLFPTNEQYYNIVDLIKYWCLLYYFQQPIAIEISRTDKASYPKDIGIYKHSPEAFNKDVYRKDDGYILYCYNSNDTELSWRTTSKGGVESANPNNAMQLGCGCQYPRYRFSPNRQYLDGEDLNYNENWVMKFIFGNSNEQNNQTENPTENN
eukprot:39165_1